MAGRLSQALILISALFAYFCPESSAGSLEDGLLVITVATEESDGFKRFMRSAQKYGYDVEVLGMGLEWTGGDIDLHPGGGQKVKLLKEAMEKYQDRKDLIIMFVDSYDVVLTAEYKEILKQFKKSESRVIFSAEGFCWPDLSLAERYPLVKLNEKRYLNSGGFIGYAPELWEIVSSAPLDDADDDQLFYTRIFLDDNLREQYAIKLDSKGEIFQNLNGALDEVDLKFKGTEAFMYNTRTGTTPTVIHGNGPIKHEFNRLANYLAGHWTPTHGCISCSEDTFSLKDFAIEDYPSVTMGIILPHPTPFINEFFQRIAKLDYPKQKIDLYVFNRVEHHSKDVTAFLETHSDEYHSVKSVTPDQNQLETEGRNNGIDWCIHNNCKYYFSVDSLVQMTNPDSLKLLIEQNRTILTPNIHRYRKLWATFWGAVTPDGYYLRSPEYIDLVQRRRLGLWNVPYISNIYLIQASKLPALVGAFTTIREDVDADIQFTFTLRRKGIFMIVTNLKNFGHLINCDTYGTDHLHNDLYQIFENRHDWVEKYIHDNYSQALNPRTEIEQPCPDVYWFPVVSATFCKHLIEEMEHFGQWSGGKNKDDRLAGGYENVPTVDIHMNQIGYERHWLHFLHQFIMPMQQKIFIGYVHDPPTAHMNFVVRYRPGEQDRLRPHHDSSTYTINIALNQPGVDYEGGGCRFVRQNCSVVDSRVGWSLIQPGRLTHYHEGLLTTKGTRYIMISFVDP
ncbi:procollagen-lysine,2-oxoglutarate 5-dioxygenase 1-like isoform X4 [Lineus longissimus]|uniref:procollagen-lysine,2-oxoglutarate 5-dioxygenase 1-like isoform X4 n=1 Tax=Lineus longissimus TaxID=88925 RepID=UPI002B4F5B7D